MLFVVFVIMLNAVMDISVKLESVLIHVKESVVQMTKLATWVNVAKTHA